MAGFQRTRRVAPWGAFTLSCSDERARGDLRREPTKDRPGINQFTKQPITIKGKPAQKKVRATALKALKDLIQ